MLRHDAKLIGSRAFTLVELLVVVAIIAVLIAVLLPALGKARQAARSLVCMSNLRTITTAATQYAGEYGGYPRANDDLMNGTINVDGDWLKKIGSYLRNMTQDQYTTSNFYLTEPFYTCPEVQAPRTGAAAVHYGMNNFFDPNYWYVALGWSQYQSTSAKYSNIRPEQILRPATSFMFGDKKLTDYAPLINYSNYQPDPRHEKSVNMAFVDTHTEYVSQKDSIKSASYQFLKP